MEPKFVHLCHRTYKCWKNNFLCVNKYSIIIVNHLEKTIAPTLWTSTKN